jgi:hypothetical protein
LNTPMSVVSAKEHEAVVRTQELAMRPLAQNHVVYRGMIEHTYECSVSKGA